MDIADKYFNNPQRPNGVVFCLPVIFPSKFTSTGVTRPLCCDNCLCGRQNDPDVTLTEAESKILAFINCLHTQILPLASQDIIDVDALNVSPEKS